MVTLRRRVTFGVGPAPWGALPVCRDALARRVRLARRPQLESSLGEIGIRSIGNPSASSIAAAIRRSRDHPGLARALDAERVQRRRGLQVVDLDRRGTSVAYGIRKSMNDALSSCPCSS